MVHGRASVLLQPGSGTGPSEHACFGYGAPAERASVVTDWLATGLRRGDRALYVGDASVDVLLAELSELDDVAALASAGALVVAPVGAVYDLSVPIDAESQLAVYDAVVQEAVADGYLGLRVAADMTALVADPARRRSHLQWEQFADRYLATHPLSALCLYDRRRVLLLDSIVCVHALQGPAPPFLAVFAEDADGAVVEGEVDMFTAGVLADILDQLPNSDQRLDLSALWYVDASSAAVLQELLDARRRAGHPLGVTGASAVVHRVWDDCGFDPALLAP
jgi:anti-anti-sigma regulatory factor